MVEILFYGVQKLFFRFLPRKAVYNGKPQYGKQADDSRQRQGEQ